MKLGFMALVALFSSAAFAGPNVDGLSCKMEYSTSSVIATSGRAATSGWLKAGDTMSGTAYREQGSQEAANSIKVDSEKVGNQEFWKVTILDAKKEVVSSFNFKNDITLKSDASGAKLVVPVNAYDEGEEDPTNFDVLEVSCYNTIFAG